MANYDKYEPYAGGFRAPLAAAWSAADLGKPYGVGLNASGQLVKGAGATGVIGVWVMTKVRPAGTPEDPMTQGQITEFGPTAATPGVGFGNPGTRYYSDASGVISSTLADGSVFVGHTVEGTRLIVNVNPVPIEVA